MSKFDRRYKGEDTHTLDGAPWWDGVVVVTIVLFGGVGMWLYRQVRKLFWWALRLHFLTLDHRTLHAYGVDNPTKERIHARLAGICMAGILVAGTLTYYSAGRIWPLLTVLSALGYVCLTAIYFLNKRDNPVAYSWDVGGDE